LISSLYVVLQHLYLQESNIWPHMLAAGGSGESFRAFFWEGKDEVNGGQCRVAWQTICKPKCFGGLGVKDLKLQGLALRMRWEWLGRTDESRTWYGLLMMKDTPAREAFDSLVSIQIGNGRKVLFWRDRWLNRLETLAP
jgi:hypothetical protein